jgi:hypothetical protein
MKNEANRVRVHICQSPLPTQKPMPCPIPPFLIENQHVFYKWNN